MKYKFDLQITLVDAFVVEAKDEKEAKVIFKKLYENGEVDFDNMKVRDAVAVVSNEDDTARCYTVATFSSLAV